MFAVLNRFSIVLSLVFGILVAYFFCGFDSYPSDSFLEWGWLVALVAAGVLRAGFLSKDFIEGALENGLGHAGSMQTAHGKTAPSHIAGASTEDQADIEATDIGSAVVETRVGKRPHVAAEAVSAPVATYSAPAEPKKPNAVVAFFSDRPLAKIGGTLLFLGAVFFLSLVWQQVGPVGKILIGLGFGFSLYGIGVWMARLGHEVESRTLLGVGIAINALTILSGRWMIGGNEGYLSDTVAMAFLVLNTLFAVATALVYSSRTFLLFSFAFGYVIPFVIGAEPHGPYGLLGYDAILTVAGYVLSGVLSRRGGVSKLDGSWLLNVVVAGSFLVGFINAFAVGTTEETAVFVGVSVLLSIIGAVVDVRNFKGAKTAVIVAAGYASLFVLLSKTSSVVPIFLGIVPLFALSAFSIAAFGAGVLLSWTLFLPLVLGVAMLFAFGIHSFAFVIVPIFLLYGAASVFVLDRLSVVFRYAFFAFVGGFMVFSGIFSNLSPVEMPEGQRLAVSLAGIAFFVFSSGIAVWKRFEYLILMSNVMSAVLLAFVLVPTWGLSWAMFGLFVIAALSVPFASVSLTRETPPLALALQKTAVALFAVGEIAYLGKDLWFSGAEGSMVTLGFVYLGIAAFSTAYSLMLARALTGVPFSEFSELSDDMKNGVYGILAVPVSLFSLAVAVVFADSPGVVSFVWILESAVLAFLYGKARDTHLVAWATVLLGIGLLKILPFFDSVVPSNYASLVSVGLIAAALFAGVSFIGKRESTWSGIFDALHSIGTFAVAATLAAIVPTDYEAISVSALFVAAALTYRNRTGLTGSWFAVATAIFTLAQLGEVRAEALSASLNLSALAVVALSAWYVSKTRKEGRFAFTFALVAALFITSDYVRVFSENVFAVTIYLAFVAAGLLFAGISADVPKFRTAGLYVGSYMLVKILFYDLWAGVDDLSVRVLALMVTGGLMIALSQLYGRSVKRGWSEEFSWRNFSDISAALDDAGEGKIKMATKISTSEDNPFTGSVAEELGKIDVSQVLAVRFVDASGTSFVLRRAGIFRIAVRISETFGKTEFRPGELSAVFDKAVPYVKSSLAKKDLDAVLAKLSAWIASGGSFEIQKK